jgi:diguanylate cyclase (GGDEF)-like protein
VGPVNTNLVYVVGIILAAAGILYICNLKQQIKELKKTVRRDPLTGLLNKGALADDSEHIFDVATGQLRSGYKTAIVFIDFDHFKRVNDNHGHLVGDRALQFLSNKLTSSFRRYDRVYRYGGEEFLAVITVKDIHTLGLIMEKVRKTVEKTAFVEDGVKIKFTVSLGATTINTILLSDVDEAVKLADDAVYAAKEAGRNCSQYYDPAGESDQNFTPKKA